MKTSVAVNPSIRFRELTKEINSLTNFLGVDVMAPILKFNYRTGTTIFAIVSYTAFAVFSVVNNGGDLVESLKASSMLGGLFHGLGKFLTCLLKQKNMRNLTLFTRSIYEEYEERGMSYRTALNTNIDKLISLIRVIRNGYFITFFIMTFLPLARLFYDGTRVTAMQYVIPGVPLESNIGYTVTYFVQLISMVVTAVGFYGGDLFVFLGLTQILTFADLMQIKIDELNESLEEKAQSRALLPVGFQIKGEEKRHHLLLEIIKWHQLFTDYCRTVNAIYHELIATQVLTMGISMMISFSINLSGFNLSLAIFFVISAYSMSIYCFLGTKLEFGYDQIYESICNVAWYELNADQRKLFGVMLRESQHPPTIKILGIMSLSVKTALQIVKLMYSVSMMMMNRS
ncbi:putative odorant receptor 83c [Drosophila serrata]|uniref:putative odorant receptor 83c n=1 Tax=Drosophila serrata TaxID=7274 RepID=UPI000A1D240B|nr:putative odorant receptor 83c [Drosophila serrata]